MVCWNLHQAHLFQVGLIQIPAGHNNQISLIGSDDYFDILVHMSRTYG